MESALYRHELMRRDLAEKPVFLPLMTRAQPDTTERKRLEVQAIPFALPEKKRKEPDEDCDPWATDEEWQEWSEWR